MMAVAVTTAGAFTVGPPQALFEIASSYRPGAFPYRRYDVTLDGRRFLMFEDRDAEEPPVTQIVVVQNWSEELKRTVQPLK